MINATVAGSHRFGTVRKHGYDPAEVDAVVERLADALAASEGRIHVLEQRLEESSVSSTAIARTLAAVEQTKDEIISEATAEADRIREEARAEASSITTTGGTPADDGGATDASGSSAPTAPASESAPAS